MIENPLSIFAWVLVIALQAIIHYKVFWSRKKETGSSHNEQTPDMMMMTSTGTIQEEDVTEGADHVEVVPDETDTYEAVRASLVEQQASFLDDDPQEAPCIHSVDREEDCDVSDDDAGVVEEDEKWRYDLANEYYSRSIDSRYGYTRNPYARPEATTYGDGGGEGLRSRHQTTNSILSNQEEDEFYYSKNRFGGSTMGAPSILCA